jgi:hypothetical protein
METRHGLSAVHDHVSYHISGPSNIAITYPHCTSIIHTQNRCRDLVNIGWQVSIYKRNRNEPNIES